MKFAIAIILALSWPSSAMAEELIPFPYVDNCCLDISMYLSRRRGLKGSQQDGTRRLSECDPCAPEASNDPNGDCAFWSCKDLRFGEGEEICKIDEGDSAIFCPASQSSIITDPTQPHCCEFDDRRRRLQSSSLQPYDLCDVCGDFAQDPNCVEAGAGNFRCTPMEEWCHRLFNRAVVCGENMDRCCVPELTPENGFPNGIFNLGGFQHLTSGELIPIAVCAGENQNFGFGFSDQFCPAVPPTKDMMSGGDPHFKTWNGTWYDFHGICDLVLLQTPRFANSKGLTIHIRTKARYEYSYIESAVIKIGNDVLEIRSFGEYSYNGVTGAKMPAAMGGKYKVGHTEIDPKKHSFEIMLDSTTKEAITVDTFKDMVSVSVKNASSASFGPSVGMMGNYGTGVLLGRDGVTVVEDHSLLGQEWQVLESEPMLFETARPTVGCAPPSIQEAERRRLAEATIETEAAEKACSHHKDKDIRDMCIFDVIAMADLEVAEAHGAF